MATIAYLAVLETTKEVPVMEVAASVWYDAVSIGETVRLEASLIGEDEDDATWQWYSSEDGENYSAISDATSDVYSKTLESTDVGLWFTCAATLDGTTYTADAIYMEEAS